MRRSRFASGARAALGALCIGLLLIGIVACSDRTSTTGQAVPLRAEELARKNSCMACHGMVHKQVGPGFAQVAERYRNDPEAAARLAEKIRQGGVGAWGRVIMPAQTLVTEADARVLVQWILAQPPPP